MNIVASEPILSKVLAFEGEVGGTRSPPTVRPGRQLVDLAKS